jgi:hypothetical protein
MRHIHHAGGAEGARRNKKKQSYVTQDRRFHAEPQIAADILNSCDEFARAVFISAKQLCRPPIRRRTNPSSIKGTARSAVTTARGDRSELAVACIFAYPFEFI